MDDMEKAYLIELRARAATAMSSIASVEELRDVCKLPKQMHGKTLAEEQQEALTSLMDKSGQPGAPTSQRTQESSGSAPQKPTTPNRADAQDAIRDGSFPAYVAYWEAMGYSRNGIITQSQIGRGTFYKYLNKQEARTHELRL